MRLDSKQRSPDEGKSENGKGTELNRSINLTARMDGKIMEGAAMQNIKANKITIGKGTFIDPSAVICGPDGGPADVVTIGDNCYIGERVQIRCPEFSLGDYGKIHHDTNAHGYSPCLIGHNAWIGQFTIIDSIGGVTIGDNCGIGAHSQLWSHIKYGDTLEGCRFLSEKPLHIGKDVWFVGHCIVSPITAEDRSVAMVGSVVTRDMKENRVYAGTPAADITDKTGPAFSPTSIEEKFLKMEEYLAAYDGDCSDLRIARTINDITDDNSTWFIVESRTYTKRGTDSEVEFMKFLLPERGKFTPIGRLESRPN